MTELTAGSVSLPRRRSVAVARLGRPPEWLWGATLALQLLVTGVLTSYTYFFVDDFMFLRQAQTSSFDLTYLRTPLFEHFSPLTRVLNKVLIDAAPGSFAFARVIELALYAAAIAAMMLVLRTILGRSWIALGLSLLFGQSVFLLRLLTWWTATANILPATVFMLLALAGYLRWQEGQGNWWLALSLSSFALALLDYETAMLLPATLLVVRILVLCDSFDPREWVRILWRERWAWVGFAVLDGLALANYFHRYYGKLPHPSVGQLAHFLDISLLQTFIPGLLGIKRLPSTNTATSIACALVFCGLVALTLSYRPRAWRCLLAALLIFVITLVPLGLNRIRLFGVTIGAEPYYHQSAHFMFIVLTGFALSPRWGGRRPPRAAGTRRGIPDRWLAAAAVAGVIAYAVLYLSSARVLRNEAVLPRATESYVSHVAADVRRMSSNTGRPVNLIDLTIPVGLMPTALTPFNRYSEYFPVADLNITYNDAAAPAHVVGNSGNLIAVHYAPGTEGRLADARLSSTAQPGLLTPQVRGGAACVPAGLSQLLRIPLPHPQAVGPRPGQLPEALRISYRLPARADVPVLLSSGPNLTPSDFERHVWGPGTGAGYALIAVQSTVQQIALELPGGACVSQVTLGAFALGSG